MRALLDEVTQLLATSPLLDDEIRVDVGREARVLIAATLGWTPGDVARRLDRLMAAVEREHIRDRVMHAAARRARGEPLAYAVGTAAFRHMVLQVDARVLIPRPETEEVVEEALRLSAAWPGGIAVDIGTGSGAIALALATEGRFERVIATDISSDALDVAAGNVASLAPAIPVELRLGADLAPLDGVRARVIVSNPPYIAYEEADALPPSVRDWEPSVALFAPDRGMARYIAVLSDASRFLEPGGFVVLELDSRRAGEAAALAVSHHWVDLRIVRDLSGRERVLVARRP